LATWYGFNALRVWYVIISFGEEVLKQFIRESVEQSKHFESLVTSDDQMLERTSFVYFRAVKHKNNNKLSKDKINDSKTLLTQVNNWDVHYLRFVTGNPLSDTKHIDTFWVHITKNMD